MKKIPTSTLLLSHGFQQFGSTIPFRTRDFPGGEPHIMLTPEAVTDAVRINTRLRNSQDRERLFLAINALRGLEVEYIEVCAPYISFGRQDRKMAPGEPFSLRMFADILNLVSKPDRVICFDPHSDITPTVINNLYPVLPYAALRQFMEKTQIVSDNNLRLVTADAGAEKKSYALCKGVGFTGGIVPASKIRNLQQNDIEYEGNIIKPGDIIRIEVHCDDLQGAPCLVPDDICDGGRTFIQLAKKLKEKNAGDLYLFVSFGIFSYNSIEKLQQHYKRIGTTDGFRDDYPESIDVITLNI